MRLQLLRRVAQDRGRVLRVKESQLSTPGQRAPPLMRFSLLSEHTEAELHCLESWRDSAGYETSELAFVTAMNSLCSTALPRAPCEACAAQRAPRKTACAAAVVASERMTWRAVGHTSDSPLAEKSICADSSQGGQINTSASRLKATIQGTSRVGR